MGEGTRNAGIDRQETAGSSFAKVDSRDWKRLKEDKEEEEEVPASFITDVEASEAKYRPKVLTRIFRCKAA